jgi:hypothetical protein
MNIDEAIGKARHIVDEIYRKNLAAATTRSPGFGIRSTRTEDLERFAQEREKAIKGFMSYIRHVETLTLKVEKPNVVKKPHFGMWCIEKNRLSVCPVVRFKSSIREGRIMHVYDFDSHDDDDKGRRIPSAEFEDEGIWTHHIPADLHPLILDVVGEKLCELDRKLKEIDADVTARIDEILAAHKGKHSKKESAKFQAKLMKFMKAFPFFADSNAQFVMDCFQIEYNDLEGLQKFLKTNRADVNFVTVEDIEEARQLAQIAEVHDG